MLEILVGGLLLVAPAVGLNLLYRSRWYQHRQLFRQLCRVHQLDGPGRRHLRQVASQLRVPYPAWIFVDPRCLVAARKLSIIPPAQLEQLHTKLFGQAPEAPTTSESPETPASK